MNLRLSSTQRAQLQRHASACLPEEACGLIGGREVSARLVLPVTNRLHSATRFEMEPREQVRAFHALDQAGLALLAIYHSHPHGPDHPSASDLAAFQYPGVFSLILSPGAEGWALYAFSMEGERFVTVDLLETTEC